MRLLKELLCNVEVTENNVPLDIEINGLTLDHTKALPQFVFFSLKADSAAAQIAAGNGAVIVSETLFDGLACIKVTDIRAALSIISANFYNNPAKALHVIGVVGTNGKTTTTKLIAQILRTSGKKCAVVGTLGADIEGEYIDCALTTPDPIELHRLLRISADVGAEYVVMEVSAHAIFLKKMLGIKCDYAVFTNISQDHLDFFKDMGTYSEVKLGFFSPENINAAVVNSDDMYGIKLINDPKVLTLSYGLKNPCDTFAMDIRYSKGRTRFLVNAYDKIMELDVPLLGEFNVYNTLASISVCVALGVDCDTIARALADMPEIPGRFNIINSDITVIIDYAHTPDGLINVLSAAKKLGAGLITVFGCGGDRDKSKRPVMGEIAATYSDLSIITSDNPRNEPPERIIEEIAVGYKNVSNNYIKITDRIRAVEFAVRIASPGDVILIAGKGAEQYIDERGTKRPYSDKQTAQNAIRRYRSDKVDN